MEICKNGRSVMCSRKYMKSTPKTLLENLQVSAFEDLRYCCSDVVILCVGLASGPTCLVQ